jgi:hypothetical protein
MLSGSAKFELSGIQIDADFINGKITNGKMCVDGTQYDGTYDSHSLLDGDYCSTTIKSKTYTGMYKSGIMVHGITKVDDKIIEQGKYAYCGHMQQPMLIKGKKIDNKGVVWDGTYDKYGYLISGIRIVSNNTYKGKFIRGVMVNGEVRYVIGSNMFTAEYKLFYDSELNTYLLKTCYTKWCGTIEELSNKLLILVCCDCLNSEVAHRFYLKHLSQLDSSSIRYLRYDMFQKLSSLEKIGLHMIISNLKKYTDYCGVLP